MGPIQRAEWAILKEFNQTLSEEERRLLKEFWKLIPPILNTDEERRHRNRLGMAFVEGLRVGRRLERELHARDLGYSL